MYVEYEDGEIGYYELLRDPDDLTNIVPSLSVEKRQRSYDVLRANEECKGTEACWNAQRLEP